MNMTKAQIQKLQHLTNRLTASHGPCSFRSSAITFKAVTLKGGSVLFTATNNNEGIRWFETFYTAYALIGPRGGVNQYEGNIKL